jgi:hypothetical protein
VADITFRWLITLQVADKPAVKEMTTLLVPLLKALGSVKKAFLAPLTRYWVKPCCEDPNHHLNYTAATYLPALGASVFRLLEYIRDSLYTRRTSNFRVVCANKLLGIGPNLSDDSARKISRLWGNDAVHPQPAAYIALAGSIETDILQEGVHYTNTPKQPAESLAKRQKLDLSQSRQPLGRRLLGFGPATRHAPQLQLYKAAREQGRRQWMEP